MEPQAHRLPVPSWRKLPELLNADGFAFRLPQDKGPAELFCNNARETFEVLNVTQSHAAISIKTIGSDEVAARLERILLASDSVPSLPELLLSQYGLLARGSPDAVQSILPVLVSGAQTVREDVRTFCAGRQDTTPQRFGWVERAAGRIHYETGPCFDSIQGGFATFIYIKIDFARRYLAERQQTQHDILALLRNAEVQDIKLSRQEHAK